MIHIDVSDGHFAPNISMGPDTVKSLRNVTRLPLDVHLMIEEPEKFLDRFLDAGGDIVTVHAEVVDEKRLRDFSRTIHSAGKKLGLALKPSTTLPSWFQARLENIDLLLILSVNPGFAGQQFMPSVLPKLAEALLELGSKDPMIVVLGSDTSVSIKTNLFGDRYPERFFNVGIAEANMIGIAAGLALSGKIPFVSTYSAFVPGKCLDQIRN